MADFDIAVAVAADKAAVGLIGTVVAAIAAAAVVVVERMPAASAVEAASVS